MKKLVSLHKLFLLGMLSVSAFLSSCNDETIAPIETQEEMTFSQKCQMVLEATKPSYNDAATRASSSDWEDGSTIYISFETTGTKVLGMATYASSTGLWEVAYGGSLPVISNGKCSLYYFEDADDINTKGASIGGTTGIFEDLNGVYAFDGEKISISAKLTPKLGRVRFSGNKNDTIMLAGVKRYGYFDASSCTYKLDSTEVLLSASVQEGDKYYTPYYYGALIDGNKTLELTDMKDAFARYCSDIFKAGNSGYMKIPHTDNYSGWMKNNPLSQSSVSINWSTSISDDRRSIIQNMIDQMVLVEGGSFWMGSQNYDSNMRNYNSRSNIDEGPVHHTIISPFYLGRTEITEKQWEAVMNSKPNYSYDDYYPVKASRTNFSTEIRDGYINFIKKLNEITNLNFTLPTEAEWEYAGYGGKNGSYKTFAGTKNYDTKYMYVSSSSPYCAIVGSKLPNEIGLYDMSGNVAEMCYSIGTYTEKEIINPRWDSSSYTYHGGSSYDIYYYNVSYSYGNHTPISLSTRTKYVDKTASLIGFRIALRLIDLK